MIRKIIFTILVWMSCWCMTSCIRIEVKVPNKEVVVFSKEVTRMPIDVEKYDAIDVSSIVAVYMSDTIESGYVVIDTALARYYNVDFRSNTLYASIECDLSYENNNASAEVCKMYLPTNKQLKSVKLRGASSMIIESPIDATNFFFDLSGTGSLDFRSSNPQCSIEGDLSGASSLTLEGKMSDLEMDLSGSSEATVSLVGMVKEVEAGLSGASNLTLEGTVDNLEIECSGASYVYGAVTCNKADIDCGGASGVSGIVCKEQLNAEAHGTSVITYSGNPTIKHLDASGVSSIDCE